MTSTLLADCSRWLALRAIRYVMLTKLYLLLRLRQRQAADAYAQVFYQLNSNRLLYGCFQCIAHEYQLSYKEYLLNELIICLEKLNHPFVILPSAQPDPALQALMHSGTAFVLASLHTGFAFTSKLLSQYHCKIAMIAHEAEYVHQYLVQKNDIQTAIQVIARDRYSFAHLAKLAASGHVISCHIDYPIPPDPSFKYVSDGLFRFSQKLALPIYFVKNEISDIGAVALVFDGPYTDAPAEQILQQFIRFMNMHRTPPRVLMPHKFDWAALDA